MVLIILLYSERIPFKIFFFQTFLILNIEIFTFYKKHFKILLTDLKFRLSWCKTQVDIVVLTISLHHLDLNSKTENFHFKVIKLVFFVKSLGYITENIYIKF